jgi:hypothetical protein
MNKQAQSRRAFLFAIVAGQRNPRSFARMLKLTSRSAAQLLLLSVIAMTLGVAQEVVSVLHGTIMKVDKTTKTLVVKTTDGAEHTIRVTNPAVIHGTKDGFAGLRQGSEVVVRATGTGTQATAEDIADIGKDGMKVMEGTIEDVDRGTNTLTVKDVDGVQETFEYTDHAANDLSQVVVKGAERGARVTVYYTEEGSKKMAYFFASGHRHSRPNPLATSTNGKTTTFLSSISI